MTINLNKHKEIRRETKSPAAERRKTAAGWSMLHLNGAVQIENN
jgi:hypothetical protein